MFELSPRFLLLRMGMANCQVVQASIKEAEGSHAIFSHKSVSVACKGVLLERALCRLLSFLHLCWGTIDAHQVRYLRNY